jgi:hypothetical protein
MRAHAALVVEYGRRPGTEPSRFTCHRTTGSWNGVSELSAEIAQLGERQTEDLKVPGSIPGLGKMIPSASLPPQQASPFINFRVRELNPGHLRDRQIY